MNDFLEENESIEIPILQISPDVERRQRQRLADLRQSRDPRRVEETLSRLRQAATNGTNIMPPLLEAVRAYTTLGEQCHAMAAVFGVYEEPAVF